MAPDTSEAKRFQRPPGSRVVKQIIKWTAVGGSLLTLSAMPCPECGAPLGIHLLPVAVLFIAARAVARRARWGSNSRHGDETSHLPPRWPSHEPTAPILELTDVSVRYDGTDALDGVSFRLEPDERVAVVGPNGAGKSTLFKVVAGVIHPTAGTVKVYGHGPGGHICIGYVPQRSQVDWSFPANVADVVMMGRTGRMGLFHWPRQEDWETVRRSLELVGMQELAHKQIGELSGGQQQRVFIARTLVQEAEILLMDEPLTGLDVPAQEDILHVIDLLREQGVTVMAATHDLNLAARHFDRVMLLNRRLLGFGKPSEVFTPENLRLAYGGHVTLMETDEGTLVVGDTCCGDDWEVG